MIVQRKFVDYGILPRSLQNGVIEFGGGGQNKKQGVPANIQHLILIEGFFRIAGLFDFLP